MHKLLFLAVLLLFSCGEDAKPKPKAYLSLEFEKDSYKNLELKRPYSFQVASQTKIIDSKSNWLKIEYPKLKASIDITYRPIQNNLTELLVEAQKLVFKHTIKADQIVSNDFINEEKRVFGSLYEITGNAASQLQFHLSDSTKNFIKGSLYFKTRPNYDSVLPAVDYIKKDILHLIETLEWED